jgi:hypothetical protein
MWHWCAVFRFVEFDRKMVRQRSCYILPCSALRTRQQLPTAWLLLVCACALSGLATGDERTQRYQTGEQVVLWANKVGPYENPQVCVCVSVCLSVCV